MWCYKYMGKSNEQGKERQCNISSAPDFPVSGQVHNCSKISRVVVLWTFIWSSRLTHHQTSCLARDRLLNNYRHLCFWLVHLEILLHFHPDEGLICNPWFAAVSSLTYPGARAVGSLLLSAQMKNKWINTWTLNIAAPSHWALQHIQREVKKTAVSWMKLPAWLLKEPHTSFLWGLENHLQI